MPNASISPPPLAGRASFLATLKDRDGAACAGAVVLLTLHGPGLIMPDSRSNGGNRFLFARTDESGGVPFLWVESPAWPSEAPVAIEASAATGARLSLRRL